MPTVAIGLGIVWAAAALDPLENRKASTSARNRACSGSILLLETERVLDPFHRVLRESDLLLYAA
jgi:hypothetical protein